ncbi:MAG TPA: amidohydrolase family protein [Actinomycetota bacterium]
MSDPLSLRGVELFDGERVSDRRCDVLVKDGRIVSIDPAGTHAAAVGAAVRVKEGGAVLPGIVDAHVHVSLSTPDAIVAGGVTAALDLGAPIDGAFAPHPPLRMRAAGPLLTAAGGYPTRSWGAGGYGLELAGESNAREAVAMLADRGAAMIKVALTDDPALDDAVLAAVAAAARGRGLRVAAHALGIANVRTAVEAGIDVLAHTPVEPLPDDLIAALAMRGVTVISTVRAFGGAPATRANLRALAAAGCEIVYGTDLGNDGIEPGVDAEELSIVADALGGALGGVEPALRAATSRAAALAGFPPARVREGERANIIVCDGLDFALLGRPSLVLVDGKEFGFDERPG